MDLAKIPASSRERKAIRFEEKLEPNALDLDVGIMHFGQGLTVRGEAVYLEGELLFSARVSGIKEFSCSRCLEAIRQDFEKEVVLTFPLEGESINVLPELAEEIMVDHPIHVLCKKDCKGLCAVCGENLNTRSCGCK